MTQQWTISGSLPVASVADASQLLAPAVAKLLGALPPEAVAGVSVTEIDPSLADTAEFCRHYQVPLTASANCVIVAGKRGDILRYAACLALATTRVNVNTVVRKRLDARKASFAAMDQAVELSGMEYGGITPVGLPPQWPILIDAAVAASPELVVGSGIRGSKLLVTGSFLASLPGAEVVAGLADPIP